MKIRFFTIPNLLTLSNLLCGCMAAVLALSGDGNPHTPFLFIMAAAVFDFFDGFAARMLKCPSPIGLQLDSLADMVSFGVAPSAVIYTLCGSAPGVWEWSGGRILHLAVFVLAAFSALRLAKFNIDDEQHEEFTGLPTPACAMFFAALGYSAPAIMLPREALLLLTALFAWLLISPVRMFSLKFRSFGFGANKLRYIFLGAAAAMLLLLPPGIAIAAVIALYIAISTVRYLTAKRQ